MAAHALPGIGLTGGRAAGEDGWADEMNANLLRLSVLTQLSVLSRVAAVPASPADGDIYIVTADNRVAVRDSGAWSYYVPVEGWTAWVRDSDVRVTFNGTAWV